MSRETQVASVYRILVHLVTSSSIKESFTPFAQLIVATISRRHSFQIPYSLQKAKNMSQQSSHNQQQTNSETRDLLQSIATHLDGTNFESSTADQVASRFDVSPFRLWLLFKAVDANNDGYVSKDELAECLVAGNDEQSIDFSSSHHLLRTCEPLQQLWDMLADRTKEEMDQQEITYPQFSRLIRYLWLQELLEIDTGSSTSDYSFHCIDYGGSYFEHKHIPGCSSNTESRHFFTVPRHPQARMRWIDVPPDGKSAHLTVLRLAVKYRFHPTSVEDAIDLELQAPDIDSFGYSLQDLGHFSMDSLHWLKHGSQIETGEHHDDDNNGFTTDKGTGAAENDSFGSEYGSNYSMYEEPDIAKEYKGLHYFISMPTFELTEQSKSSLEQFLSLEKNSTSPKHLLLLRRATAGQLEQSPLIIEIKRATLGIFVASKPHPNLVVTVSTKWIPTRIKRFHDCNEEEAPEVSSFAKETMASVERVKSLLQKRHSLQRYGNSDWLLYSILDAIVDNLRPISNIYETKLKLLSKRLLEVGHRLSSREVKEIIVMKRDLEWLHHELRPMLIVLRHLIAEKNIGVEVTHYLQDIEDHMNLLLDELSSYARESEAMREEFNSYSDRRMNDVLYLLTLVTTLFVPAQFFTGYFGMNFVDSDTGESALVLLNLGWKGLASFWIMTSFTTSVVVLVMYYYKWFERPREV